ncbi:hypothetical protein [Mycolicibacter hiberniae]|uniref:hypothetical protein n=1 Tax=Mycolicibacter hiberniae TaxID=29314 RepID=UPI0013D69A89|nr:hypothetical protein [Mycolicibacter hiberniae]MCV7085716.1 hypothetical protein [Mycolicibacter hiberniae]
MGSQYAAPESAAGCVGLRGAAAVPGEAAAAGQHTGAANRQVRRDSVIRVVYAA